MPTIPRLQRRQNIPGGGREALPPLALAGQESKAFGQLAETVQAEANRWTDILIQRKNQLAQQDNVNTVISRTAAYEEERRTFTQQQLQLSGLDTYGNLDAGKKFKDDSLEKYTKDIDSTNINGGDLKLTIEKYINSDANQMLDVLARHQTTQRGVVTKSTIENLHNGLLKDAYDGLVPLETNIQKLTTSIGAHHVAGSLGDVEAEELIVKGAQELAEANLDGIISRDPILAEEVIKSGKFKKYLPEDKIKEYDTKAKILQKAREADIKTAAITAEKEAAAKLKEARELTGIDFVRQRNEDTLTEETILKSNLEPTGENGMSSHLSALKQDKKEALAAAKETVAATEKAKKEKTEAEKIALQKDREQTGIAFELALSKDTLTEEMISESPLDGADRLSWRGKVRKQAQNKVKADLYQKVEEDPAAISVSQIRQLAINQQLTVEDANQLITYREKQNKTDDPEKTLAVKTARTTLNNAKTKKLFNSDPAVNINQWAFYQSKLTDYVTNHPEATPEDINGFVESILTPVETGWIDDLLDTMQPGTPQLDIIEAQKKTEISKIAGEKKMPEKPPKPNAKQGKDGNWYIPDPNRPGKYLRIK